MVTFKTVFINVTCFNSLYNLIKMLIILYFTFMNLATLFISIKY